jgi:hypothetical protein
MPPRKGSRHALVVGQEDTAGKLELTEREPFRFRTFDDNRTHVVREGDTLHSLAARYFSGLARPAGFWWVIADFQPDPIVDPTIALETGRVLVVPSVRTLTEEILSEKRRLENTPA